MSVSILSTRIRSDQRVLNVHAEYDDRHTIMTLLEYLPGADSDIHSSIEVVRDGHGHVVAEMGFITPEYAKAARDYFEATAAIDYKRQVDAYGR